VDKTSIPGFTAEVSLCQSKGRYVSSYSRTAVNTISTITAARRLGSGLCCVRCGWGDDWCCEECLM
jgi:hypothetical protein